jgi:hypothetical protein
MLAPYPVLPHLMHIAMQGVGSTPVQYARTHRSKKHKVQRGRRNRRHYIKSLMGSW